MSGISTHERMIKYSGAKFLSHMSHILEAIKNIALIVFFGFLLWNNQLLNEYLLSERIKLVEKLPSVYLAVQNRRLYFKTRSTDAVKVSKTKLLFRGSKGEREINVNNAKSYSNLEIENILKRVNVYREGRNEVEVLVVFETNLGTIDGKSNPYVFEYLLNSRGGYEDYMFYKDGALDIIDLLQI